MTTVQLLVAGGLVLGFVQLVAGIAIGLWMGRGRSGSLDALRAQSLAGDLQRLTQSLNTSVKEHAAEVGAIDNRLRVEQTAGAPLTELVVGVVGELLAANQKLGRELVAAETELERQSIELDQHLQASLTERAHGPAESPGAGRSSRLAARSVAEASYALLGDDDRRRSFQEV